ncbi:hypothetical protein [Selenomonas sp. KH1T6]|uniref:hypothetical protein n=1 Tax=Selenomonas sp. KH1T6 TaxID=3158784 RepID=UPI0008A7EAB7|nr:hypothetical protein SAMN05216583_1013 [Selenomonas ruminantium]
MRRPAINIDQHNLLVYIGVGAGWFLAGLLELIDGGIALKAFQIILFLAIVIILLYTAIGKNEEHDEMTFAYYKEALAAGFHSITITCLLFTIVDALLDYTIPFHFAGYIMLGIGYFSAGWKFRQLERDGE